MLVYTGKKLMQLMFTIVGVVTLVFFAMRLIPGDASSVMAGENLSAEALERVRANLGLDDPLWMQYLTFWGKLFQFDFGTTITTSLPIVQLLMKALPITLLIAFCTVVLKVIIAIPIGTLAAFMANKGKKSLDNALTWTTMVLDLMPGFWVALLLMLVLSLHMQWLPATGPVTFDDPWMLAKRLALPIIVLAIGSVASLARITRTAVLEVLNEDYIKAARSLGAAEVLVIFRHGLRNALLPIITVIGLSFGNLLNGTVITEVIFALPNIGQILLYGISSRDYPLVQDVILVYALMFITVNFVTDLIYKKVDPRVQF